MTGKKRATKKRRPAVKKSAVKKRAVKSGQSDALDGETALPIRAGMPAPDSIISEETFVSPKGNVYRILKTNERDDYDNPLPPQKKRSRRR
jgi:hypothetical protein